MNNQKKSYESSASSNFFLPLSREDQAARLDWKFEHNSFSSDEDTKIVGKTKISPQKLDNTIECLSTQSLWLSSESHVKNYTVLSVQERNRISKVKGKQKQVKFKSKNESGQWKSTKSAQHNTQINLNYDKKEIIYEDDRIDEDMTNEPSCSRVKSDKDHKLIYSASSESERTKQESNEIDLAKYELWEELSLKETEKPKFSIQPVGNKVNFQLNKDESVPQVIVPATINQYLRDYQREGIQFLYEHYSNKTGAILGDDMGLGKTVQFIGFLSALLGKQGNKLDTLQAVPKFIRQLSRDFPSNPPKRPCKPFLIIGPSAVMFNWLDEINTWGYFSARKFHGADKDGCLADLEKGKLEIIVTTFETFRDYVDRLNQFEWEAVIVDEVHKIKGLKAQITQSLRKINTPRRFGLTGTALQNSLTDLWSILDWAQPGVLGSLKKFEKDFVDVIEMGQRHDATKRELAQARKQKNKFAEIRNKMLLRRTKALIADQLPKKEDLVVLCKLTDLQISVYKAILSHPDMELVLHSGDPCDCDSGKQRSLCCYKVAPNGMKIQALVFSYMHLMLKAANHIALLLPDDKMSEKQATMTRRVCEVAFKDHPQFVEQTQLAAFRTLSDPKYCGKMKILAGLLSVFASSHDKVLVFSYSTRLLDIIEQYVISQGYEYRRIDGKVNSLRRRDIVLEFNKDNNIFLCLISTKAGGLGINMTSANRVVIFDPNWNPSHDLQAQDRAYRLGQTRNVQVFRLVSAGTIEENIYLRQIYKQQLDEVAVGTGNARRYFFGKQGDRENQGELFGIKNIFSLRTGESSLTLDILKRNENIEKSLAGYDITKYVPPPAGDSSSDVDFSSSDDERIQEEEDDDDSESFMRNLFGPDKSLQIVENKISNSNSITQNSAAVVHAGSDESDEEFSLIPKLHHRSHKCSLVTSPVPLTSHQVRLSSLVPGACDVTQAKNGTVDDLTFSTCRIAESYVGQQHKNVTQKSGVYKRGAESGISWLFEDDGDDSKVIDHKSKVEKSRMNKRGAESGISWLFDDDEVNSNITDHKNGTTTSGVKNSSLIKNFNAHKSQRTASISDHDTTSKSFKTSCNNGQKTSASVFPSLQSVLNGDGVLHTVANEKIVGSSRAEDHMTHCAMEDVFENHINSQAPALQCDPYTQPEKRKASKRKMTSKGKSRKKREFAQDDYNTKQAVQVDCYKVLVGQTPAAVQRQQWAELCKFKSVEDLDLARTILSSKVEDRLELLKEFYSQQHPDLRDTFEKFFSMKTHKSNNLNTNRTRLLTSNKEKPDTEREISITSKYDKSFDGKIGSKNHKSSKASDCLNSSTGIPLQKQFHEVDSQVSLKAKTTQKHGAVYHSGKPYCKERPGSIVLHSEQIYKRNEKKCGSSSENVSTLKYMDMTSCPLRETDDLFSQMHKGDKTATIVSTEPTINTKNHKNVTDVHTNKKDSETNQITGVQNQKHSIRHYACILDDIFESLNSKPESNSSEVEKRNETQSDLQIKTLDNNFVQLATSKPAVTDDDRSQTSNIDSLDGFDVFYKSSTLKEENVQYCFQRHIFNKTDRKPLDDSKDLRDTFQDDNGSGSLFS